MNRRNRILALARAGLRRLLDENVATAVAMTIAGVVLYACGIGYYPGIDPFVLVGRMILWLMASAGVLVAIHAAASPLVMKGE